MTLARTARHVATAAALCLTAGLGCGSGDREPTPKPPLRCLVTRVMRPAIERLAKDYERQTGQPVRIESGGDAELLARILADGRADLYVSRDPFPEMLRRAGLCERGRGLATLTPTIVVAQGNPRTIASVKDLATRGLRLAVPDAPGTTIGWVAARVFAKAGLRKQIKANVTARPPDAEAAAELVEAGKADAAIVWNAVAHARPGRIEAVPIEPALSPVPGIDAVTSATGRSYDIGRIGATIDVLTCSGQPDAAWAFARFASERSKVFVEEFGFAPAEPAPAGGRLTIHCDTSLRHAMEDAAAAFEKASDAKLTVHYQLSGMSIATIKLTRQGDLYAPADARQLEQLAKDGSLVPMAPGANAAAPVAIGLLTFAQNRPLARDFMAFLAGKRGRAIFAKHAGRPGKPR